MKSEEKCAPSVLSPCRSSPALNTTSYFSSQHFVFKRLWQNSFHFIPGQTKNANLHSGQTTTTLWQHGDDVIKLTYRQLTGIQATLQMLKESMTTAIGEKRTSKDRKKTKCQRIVKSIYLLFPETQVWNPKAKTTPNLRIFYVSAFQFLPFPTNVSLSGGHTLLLVGAAGIFLFPTWPFTNSCKIFYGIAIIDN